MIEKAGGVVNREVVERGIRVDRCASTGNRDEGVGVDGSSGSGSGVN